MKTKAPPAPVLSKEEQYDRAIDAVARFLLSARERREAKARQGKQKAATCEGGATS